MSKMIFGEEILYTINIFQACFILDANNWKKDYTQFNNGFRVCNEDENYVCKDGI